MIELRDMADLALRLADGPITAEDAAAAYRLARMNDSPDLGSYREQLWEAVGEGVELAQETLSLLAASDAWWREIE